MCVALTQTKRKPCNQFSATSNTSKLQLANFRTNNKEHTGAEASAMLRIKSSPPHALQQAGLQKTYFGTKNHALLLTAVAGPAGRLKIPLHFQIV